MKSRDIIVIFIAILLVAVLGLGIGLTVYFMRNDQISFRVMINDEPYNAALDGYVISTKEPLKLTLQTTAVGKDGDFEVGIYQNPEYDFDFTIAYVDGNTTEYVTRTWKNEESVFNGFNVEKDGASVLISFKYENFDDLLHAVYGGDGDITYNAKKAVTQANLFLLRIKSPAGETLNIKIGYDFVFKTAGNSILWG